MPTLFADGLFKLS